MSLPRSIPSLLTTVTEPCFLLATFVPEGAHFVALSCVLCQATAPVFFGNFLSKLPAFHRHHPAATQVLPGTFHPGRNPWPAGSCADFSQGRSVNLVHPYFRCQAPVPTLRSFLSYLAASFRSLSLVRGAGEYLPQPGLFVNYGNRKKSEIAYFQRASCQ